MIWALALLLSRTPDVLPSPPMSSESAAVAISVTDEALDLADETQATAEPEAKPKASAATPEASTESSSRDAQPLLNHASFRTRRELAKLFGTAEEKPAYIAPSGTEPPATSTSTSNAANVPGSPSLSSADASPVPAGRAPFLAAGRARIPKLWYTLVAAGHGAATFDAWSTRRVIGSGNGRELDPLMRPFAHSTAIYGAIQVGPGLLDYLARRMMRSEKRWVRRLWWLPQVAGTAGSLWSGAHNLRLASH